jgi:hypothetical protein
MVSGTEGSLQIGGIEEHALQMELVSAHEVNGDVAMATRDACLGTTAALGGPDHR